MGDVKASEIAEFLGRPLINNDLSINKAVSFNNIDEGSMTFVKYADFKEPEDKKCLYLVLEDKKIEKDSKAAYIKVSNPRVAFAKVLDRFFTEKFVSRIEKTSFVEDNATIGENVYIGHNCYIGKNVSIGNNSVIKHNVTINADTKIGSSCLIKSGVVLAEDGFGFDFDEQKTPIKIPHIGRVVVKNSVEIGANTVIARGTLDDTLVNDNVKIDALVHIAHNCKIGNSSLIIASSQISGSVKIGDNCWIAPSSTIIQKREVGSGATVGIGAIVTESVKNGQTVMGLNAIEAIDVFRFKKKYKYGVK